MANLERPDASALREKRSAERSGADDIISLVFDEGTFTETLAFYGGRDGEFETVVTGYGAIDERLVYCFIEDGSRCGGAIGEGAAKKITALCSLAAKNGAPIVAVFDSAGGYIGDGVKTLSAYGEITAALLSAKTAVPLVALIRGRCAGASAVAARICDIVVAVKNDGKLYLNPPFLTGASDAAENGSVDIVAEELSQAAMAVKNALGYLPSEAGRYTVRETEEDDPNRETPELEAITAKAGYDVREVLKAIADGGVFFETGAQYAPELVTGYMRLYGIAVAVVATNPAVKGGALSISAAKKAGRVVSLSARLGMGLFNYVDSVGYELSSAGENEGAAGIIASLCAAYSQREGMTVTLIAGKAYGSAMTALGSKALGCDYVVASDRAEISVISPDAAVQLLYADKIKAAADPNAERASLLASYKAESSAATAARAGIIDDAAPFPALRKKIISAFEMLSFGL